MPKAHPIVRLEVTSVAAGGDGVAHVDGANGRRAVFVAKGAPGDVVEAEVDFSQRPARATALRVVHPSPLRVEPSCPHASSCGGCDWMHLSLDAQREAHRSIVVAAIQHALARAGADQSLPPVSVHPAPQPIGYRTRARLAVRARAGRVVVGYRRAASSEVEDVASCCVLHPRLDAALPALRRLFCAETGEGEASLALGALEGPVAEIRWNGDLSAGLFAQTQALVDAGRFAGAEVWVRGARLPARFGDPRAVTVGSDGGPLTVPSGSFAQAHPAMNLELGARVLAAAEPHRTPTVELFAGSGNLTVLLARHAASLTAVESDGRAVAAARDNLTARGLTARVVHANVERFELPPGTRTVVLDPPRGGSREATLKLCDSKVRRVAYVSCDASTLARDVALLAGARFRVVSVDTFEMFPHTSHVETLVALDRRPQASAASPSPSP